MSTPYGHLAIAPADSSDIAYTLRPITTRRKALKSRVLASPLEAIGTDIRREPSRSGLGVE